MVTSLRLTVPRGRRAAAPRSALGDGVSLGVRKGTELRLGGRPEARALARANGFGDAQASRSAARIGSRRMRLPVAAKIALATAGATAGTGGSPTPKAGSALGATCTSMAGDSAKRSTGKS